MRLPRVHRRLGLRLPRRGSAIRDGEGATAVVPVAPLSFDALFDPAFLDRVRALSLHVAMAGRGRRLADQRTRARGQGSEFADYKPYVAGDDLRAIDWHAYRRLGRLFVRVYEEHQDLPVHLVVDVSPSMFVERPARIHAAQRVALAVAAVALGRQDSANLFLAAGSIATRLRGVTGRSGLVRIAHALADIAPSPGGGMADAIGQLGGMRLRRGLALVVSDFLDPAGLDAVLDAIAMLPHTVLLVQIVQPGDADPSNDPELAGDAVIEDGEEAGVALTLTSGAVERYREAYRRFSDRLAGFAEERGIGLMRVDAAGDVADQLVAAMGPREGRPA